jgi:NTP pyrophosphatase (non-canonical NTP hydrolase)
MILTQEQYLQGVNRTWKKGEGLQELTHCLWAIDEEIGEISGWMKKIYGYGRVKDEAWKIEVMGECGDLCYYVTKLAELTDNLDEIGALFNKEIEMKILKINNFNLLCEIRTHSQALLTTNPLCDEFAEALCNLSEVLAILCEHEGFEMQDILLSNLAKLEKRHGNGFKDSAAVESGRDRSAETEALKNGTQN